MEKKIINRIIHTENLLWAWQKTKKAFSIGDIWYCEYELAKFESNIYDEIESIKMDIINQQYTFTKLKIVPFPKGYDDISKKAETRQAFYVSVRDQVTWLAVCNVIGEEIDSKMPAWSYGNRLYRPAWYENDENESKLIIGHYRNYNGYIFRKWKQSWPLFRKHINATIARIANPISNISNLTEEDYKTIQENNEQQEQC